jgi:hypothetical protein
MWISEQTFPHLRDAQEERLAAALERRRLVAERLAEQAITGREGAGARARMPRTRRSATATPAGGAGATEVCAT